LIVFLDSARLLKAAQCQCRLRLACFASTEAANGWENLSRHVVSTGSLIR
jgi:hypothetical protein